MTRTPDRRDPLHHEQCLIGARDSFLRTLEMDQSIQRLLNDKLYDKRKQGALEYVVWELWGSSEALLTRDTEG